MNESKALVPAVTEIERNRRVIANIKAISSNQLSELNNSQIALRIYFLIANGTEKNSDDFCEIGKHLHGFAIQLIGQK